MKNLKIHLQVMGLLILLFSCGSDDSSKSNISSVGCGALPADLVGDWIKVDKNSGGMGLPCFYIMKYEAKAWNDINLNNQIDIGELQVSGSTSTGDLIHNPVSHEDAKPWIRSARLSASECESLGSGFDLISNKEWMAIARDIELVDSNWSGGSIYNGCLFQGNTGVDGACAYDGGSVANHGNSRNSKAILRLSNGEEIFDFSGNVSEYVDSDDPLIPQVGFSGGVTDCGYSNWKNLKDVNCPSLDFDEYMPLDNSLDISHGVGDFSFPPPPNSGIRHRGGFFGSDRSGIYGFHNTSSIDGFSSARGFRCVYRP